MNAKEIIKRAQTECGEYATGYKGDITFDTINAICEALWKRAINLSYTTTQWGGEVANTVGTKAFRYWFDNIMDFLNDKLNAQKYFNFHGQKYCA